jgi:hypothetical protein
MVNIDRNGIYVLGRSVLAAMSVYAKPVKLAFTVRADKAEEFRNLTNPATIAKIQADADKIKNVTVEGLPYERK